MKPGVLIVVALGCGLLAALGAVQYVNKAPAAPTDQVRPLLVATRDISINEKLSAENMAVVEWPRRLVPQGALQKLEDVEGKYARDRFYEREPIRQDRVMSADESGALKVPKGNRVVSVKVTVDSAVSNLLKPGDRVDVIAVMKKSQDNPTAISKIILRSICIFAVNSEMARAPDRDKSPTDTRTVSLLLSPDQVERLTMANELGIIKLALRGVDDADVSETQGCTVERIVGAGSSGQTPEPRQGKPAPAIAETNAPRWSMYVASPQGAYRLHWSDNSDQPEREELAGSATPAPAAARGETRSGGQGIVGEVLHPGGRPEGRGDRPAPEGNLGAPSAPTATPTAGSGRRLSHG